MRRPSCVLVPSHAPITGRLTLPVICLRFPACSIRWPSWIKLPCYHCMLLFLLLWPFSALYHYLGPLWYFPTLLCFTAYTQILHRALLYTWHTALSRFFFCCCLIHCCSTEFAFIFLSSLMHTILFLSCPFLFTFNCSVTFSLLSRVKPYIWPITLSNLSLWLDFDALIWLYHYPQGYLMTFTEGEFVPLHISSSSSRSSLPFMYTFCLSIVLYHLTFLADTLSHYDFQFDAWITYFCSFFFLPHTVNIASWQLQIRPS